MRDELLFHYSQELTYLRYLGAEFANKYPKVAARLLLEAGKCEDPHVERLLEGFAFLAARIHTKLDDEFPEVVESLLSVLYPYYLRPLPSASVVQFHLDPDQGKLMSGLPIPRGALLYSAPVAGTPCKFQTCYDTTLWPLVVKSADWRSADRIQPPMTVGGAAAVIRVELNCLADVSFGKLDLKTLRMFLQGDGTVIGGLIELLCNNCVQIVARDLAAPARKTVVFAPGSLRQVGFRRTKDCSPFRGALFGDTGCCRSISRSPRSSASWTCRASRNWPRRASATKSSSCSSCPISNAATAGSRSNWASPGTLSGWAAPRW